MKNINQELLNHVILHKDRIPHYHKDFPLYYCKCQDKHVHFRLFKHVQNQSFSLLK